MVVDSSTIEFYEGPLGAKYAARYGSAPRLDLVSKLQYKLNLSRQERRLALDVGCGPGQYAQALAERGFEVHLLDASRKMLEMASERLGIPQDRFLPKSIYELDWGYEKSTFDLIFACAMMVHVPRTEAQGIYEAFYQLLKPQGVLFVNFKLGDHSLISVDGRFFEYYRDQSEPERGLRDVGFEVEEVSITYNHTNMYEVPKTIKWANFYCRKLLNGNAEQNRVCSRKNAG
jgi:SAM-dependent methyltransferase